MSKKEISFTVQSFMIKDLKLKGNDLLIYALIYGFSQDGESCFKGDLDYISSLTACSRETVIRSINSMIKSGLIEKKKTITKNHYRVVINTQCQNDTVDSVKMTPPQCQNDTLSPIYNNNTINNNYNNSEIFSSFLKKYPGTKRTLETEFVNFQKKTKDWKDVLPLLENAIENQKKSREYLKRLGKFVPEWKHLSTWINNRCWEEEGELVKPFKERTDDEHYEEYVSYDSPNSMFRAKNKDELPYRELRDLSMRLENRLSIDPKYK